MCIVRPSSLIKGSRVTLPEGLAGDYGQFLHVVLERGRLVGRHRERHRLGGAPDYRTGALGRSELLELFDEAMLALPVLDNLLIFVLVLLVTNNLSERYMHAFYV